MKQNTIAESESADELFADESGDEDDEDGAVSFDDDSGVPVSLARFFADRY